ncbi:MAG: hypothetical protein AB7F98_16740 [Novosphingobium sp.]
MKYLNKLTLAVLPLAIMGTPLAAEDLATLGVKTGATIYGPQGNEVGKVESVGSGYVVVNTGAHKATLAANSFGKGDKGPSITFTRDQLNSAIEAAANRAQAQLDAALIPGASLKSSDGVALGTIKSVGEDGQVILERESGPVALQKGAFSADANGLKLNMTAAALDAAVGQAAAPAQ